MSAADPVPQNSPLRVDAARNRERLIAAAAEVFAERGLDASTFEIAARAGVSEATLFRRFPQKDDLKIAILRAFNDDLVNLAVAAESVDDPWGALEKFLVTACARIAGDRAFFEALSEGRLMHPSMAEGREDLLRPLAGIVRRAQDAGCLRTDIKPQDLLFLACSAGHSRIPIEGVREDIWRRYLGVVLDGLRPEGSTPLGVAAPARRVLGSRSR